MRAPKPLYVPFLLVAALCYGPAGVRAEDAPLGSTRLALPGVVRVGVAEPGRAGSTAAAFAGYGYTEEVLGTGDSHHRAFGSLALSARFLPWFSSSLLLKGRYDTHLDGPGGEDDDGLVGDPRLVLRAGGEVGSGFVVGAQLGVWLPGQDFPSVVLDALSLDAEALAAYRRRFGARTSLTLATRAGYRLDRSAGSAETLDRLSRADRLGLELSDFDAVLLGVGSVLQLRRLELLAEVTSDWLVGDGAPDFEYSPLRVSGGGRWRLGQESDWRLHLLAELTLSNRPEVAQGEPLVAIEPRLSASAGLTYNWAWFSASSDPYRAVRQVEGPGGSGPQTSYRGRVTDDEGQPMQGVTVTLAHESETKEKVSDQGGNFIFDALPVGNFTVAVKHEGYQVYQRGFQLSEGENKDSSIALTRIVPQGQLRGFVRSFAGEGLVADIRVLPLGTEVETHDDGSFEVDITPGKYEVIIRARGYRKQRRTVEVEEGGVTLLNIDMRRE